MNDRDLAIALVRAAGDIALAAEHRTPTTKEHHNDLVTASDVAAQAAMLRIISRERPQDGWRCEESDAERVATRQWVIDPIDGTWNYAHHTDYWCSGAALVDESGILVSAIYRPVTGELWWSERGCGAWKDDQRIQVRDDRSLTTAGLAMYVSSQSQNECMTRLSSQAGVTRSCGAGLLDQAHVASGSFDLWAGMNLHTHPWDLLPGELLIQEAGGVVTTVPVGDNQWSMAGTSQTVREACTVAQQST
jgi:myo-inositol-1(or 4)-monophosphatase